MRPHLATSLPAAVTFSTAKCRVQGRHPGLAGVVWTCSQIPGRWLLSHHRRSPKKTALGWHFVCFSSVVRGSTSATQPSVQLDLQSGTSLPTDLRQPWTPLQCTSEMLRLTRSRNIPSGLREKHSHSPSSSTTFKKAPIAPRYPSWRRNRACISP